MVRKPTAPFPILATVTYFTLIPLAICALVLDRLLAAFNKSSSLSNCSLRIFSLVTSKTCIGSPSAFIVAKGTGFSFSARLNLDSTGYRFSQAVTMSELLLIIRLMKGLCV
ncbi:MAG: hypothetical protein NTY48_06335 [Candidatus Diapherotrites archaeon]|nr:hypothetical protein [Candidatus Diapherotrites archaeon]